MFDDMRIAASAGLRQLSATFTELSGSSVPKQR
jgi:hypothetical protein